MTHETIYSNLINYFLYEEGKNKKINSNVSNNNTKSIGGGPARNGNNNKKGNNNNNNNKNS